MLEVSGSSPASAWQVPGSSVEGEQSCSTVELVHGTALVSTVAFVLLCSPVFLVGPHKNLGWAL